MEVQSITQEELLSKLYIFFQAFWIMLGLFAISKIFWFVVYEFKEKNGGDKYFKYGKKGFK